MFRTIAVALLASTLLAAPAFAQGTAVAPKAPATHSAVHSGHDAMAKVTKAKKVSKHKVKKAKVSHVRHINHVKHAKHATVRHMARANWKQATPTNNF